MSILQKFFSMLRKVSTHLNNDSVEIFIEAGDRSEHYSFPVDIIDPAIALQFAGALASSPRLPRSVNDEK